MEGDSFYFYRGPVYLSANTKSNSFSKYKICLNTKKVRTKCADFFYYKGLNYALKFAFSDAPRPEDFIESFS